jgi:hypothetical protein
MNDMKLTPEERKKALESIRQDKYDTQQREAAEKAPARNLGGALDIFKSKDTPTPKKKARGGAVKYKAGGFVKAADGIAKRGKTRGKMC